MIDKYLTIGGVATYLKTLAEGLIERNHSVYLITAADAENRKLIDQFTSFGVSVITIPTSNSRIVTAFLLIRRIYQFLKNTEIDIMHSHHRLANFAGIMISKIVDISHLITLHVFKDDHMLLTKFWKNEYVTVPSKALKKHLIEHYRFNEKCIHVISNAISTDYHIDKQKKISLQKKYFNGAEKFYVGYIGRISYEKGVDILVESIPLVQEQYPEIAFRIFGDGDGLAIVKKRCRDLALDVNKILPGKTHYSKEVLSLLDVCVLPSRSENFSLFMLECKRAGKPLIATETGGNPEIITHRKTGLLIPKEDAHALAESIITMYKNKNLREAFAGNGKKDFEENFPLQKFYRSYIAKYRSLIETPRPPV